MPVPEPRRITELRANLHVADPSSEPRTKIPTSVSFGAEFRALRSGSGYESGDRRTARTNLDDLSRIKFGYFSPCL